MEKLKFENIPSSFLDGDDAGAAAVAGAGEVKTRSSIESLVSFSGAAAVGLEKDTKRGDDEALDPSKRGESMLNDSKLSLLDGVVVCSAGDPFSGGESVVLSLKRFTSSDGAGAGAGAVDRPSWLTIS